jgi:chemotaxis protein methyltransferase CheR
MERTVVPVGDREIDAARDFLARRTGLHFPSHKLGELVAAIHERLAGLPRCRDLEGYLDLLRRDENGTGELRALVARLTVGETYFFRNHGQFAALRDQILPEIIRRRRGRGRRIRIWSAGCSTGEEPYSLAMLLLELVPDLAEWEVHLLATDINEESLAAAREGHYRNWSFREVEGPYRERFFVPEGDGYRIRPEVRGLVTFRYLNLADDLYPTAVTGTDALDLVLCRNVMIYFRPEFSREVTQRFFRALDDGGFLLVGHSEHSDLVYGGFARSFTGHGVVYRKTGPNPAWERGIALRFRGSGAAPEETLRHDPPRPRAPAVQRPPETEETVLFQRAVALVEDLRPAEAIGAFRRVLEVNPDNARALYSIAMLCANAGDDAAAAAWAGRLLRTDPLHLEGTFLLAIIARETGDRAAELAALKKTLYINPHFVLGHFHTAVAHLRGGNARLARRSFRNVLRLTEGLAGEVAVEGVEGMTVGRLRETVGGLMPPGPAEGPEA